MDAQSIVHHENGFMFKCPNCKEDTLMPYAYDNIEEDDRDTSLWFKCSKCELIAGHFYKYTLSVYLGEITWPYSQKTHTS